MAVIWGLDLKEIQWWKFRGSYMFNRTYYLRRTKMIVYLCATILTVVSEAIGTAALSDYVDQQEGIQTRYTFPVYVSNNSYVGVASFNIFVGLAVATVFGSAFVFDLFWPERQESRFVKMAWKISSLAVSLMALAVCIAATVIVATQRSTITGRGFELYSGVERKLFHENGKPNPVYRKNPECVASLIIGWLGMVFSFGSTYVMWKSINYNSKHGPKAAAYRDQELMVEVPRRDGAAPDSPRL